MRWQWYAGITLLVWGCWGLLPKLALRTLDRQSVLVWDSLGGLLIGLLVFASRGCRVQTEPQGVFYAIAYGICGLGGSYLFLLALREGKASVVVPFTSLYPVVTLALSVWLLNERPSPTNMAGVLFAVVAVILLSR